MNHDPSEQHFAYVLHQNWIRVLSTFVDFGNLILSIEFSQWTDIQDFLKSYVIGFGSLCTVQLSKKLSSMNHQASNKPLWFSGTHKTQKIWDSIWTEPNDMRFSFLVASKFEWDRKLLEYQIDIWQHIIKTNLWYSCMCIYIQ